jgi:hypothetical protein
MVVSGAGRRTRRLTLVAATLAAVTSGTSGTTEARPVTGDPGGTIQPISATTIADVEPRSPTPGFLLERGRYITLEVPGATVETGAGGINNRGEIVGGARGGGMPDRGFLRDARGRYSTFRFPGSRSTLAQKINDRGQITGYFSNTADDPREDPTGFLLASGRYTRIAFPGAVTTTAVGINNRTQVVGQYQDADGRFHGYMWHRGRFATIDAPGALDTSLTDINDRGQVIGIRLDRDGTVSAFLLHRGRFTSFSSPGAEFTAPGGHQQSRSDRGVLDRRRARRPIPRDRSLVPAPQGRRRPLQPDPVPRRPHDAGVRPERPRSDHRRLQQPSVRRARPPLC